MVELFREREYDHGENERNEAEQQERQPPSADPVRMGRLEPARALRVLV